MVKKKRKNRKTVQFLTHKLKSSSKNVIEGVNVMSTFHGLEMAKQALYAQQAALYTTGHNIANANTKGYTRQRVNFATTTPYPSGSRNRPQIPGQVGTGVQVGSIQRIRDQFLDYQFRTENSRHGYWDATANALSRMEELLNEPSDSGLSRTMDEFWQSLQDLATNPENSGARSVVANRGLAVAETFNYLSETMQSIRNDLRNQIDVTISDVNSLLRQINEINKQIQAVEPHGYLTNDLYDDRDRLIDELSEMVSIKVHYVKSSDSSLDIAEGIVRIELVDAQGLSLDNPPIFLLDGQPGDHDDAVNELDISYQDGAVSGIHVDGYGDLDNFDLLQSIGSLKGLVEAYGYVENNTVTGEYPEMLQALDRMAAEFAAAFNNIHTSGYDLNGDLGQAFFTNGSDDESELITAANISISTDIFDDPSLIAASTEEFSGNGENALALAAMFNDATHVDLDGASVNSFYESLIGSLGVRAKEANRMTDNTEILRAQVEEQRMSVSAVSLDEEMTNMIQFQHAYNAAARSMTAIDEMLDRIINNMGLVGR